jgi:preprotein translocase subunit SecG
MYTFLLVVHVFVCFFLILVILLQAGKGGGMTETLGGNLTQSILGTRSTAFMTKLTAVCASLFLITCLSLTYLSTQKRLSIFHGYKETKSTPAPSAVESSATQETVPPPVQNPESTPTAPIEAPAAETP